MEHCQHEPSLQAFCQTTPAVTFCLHCAAILGICLHQKDGHTLLTLCLSDAAEQSRGGPHRHLRR